MPILFNSVNTFVEAVGRRRDIRQWNTLDSLQCIFTGPTASVNNWIPAIGSQHPDYGNMYCSGSEVVQEAAGVTTLRTNYVGKFYWMGPVAVGSSAHWGEVSYTQFSNVNTYSTGYVDNPDGTMTAPVITYEFVSYTYSVRYLIQAATYKTISRSPNSIIGGGGGGVLNQTTYQTGRISAQSGLGLVDSTLDFLVQMIDRQVNALNNGWFEIAETWGPQPVISTTLKNIFETTITTVFG